MTRKVYNISEIEYTEVKGCKVLNCINPQEKSKKDILFNVQCICGNIRPVQLYYIYRCEKVHCKQCGYKKIALSKVKTDAGLNCLYGQYIAKSKIRGIHFDISKEDFKVLTSSSCTYCGKEPEMKSYTSKAYQHRSQYIYNSLDRVDSSLGYTIDNVVPCCKKCNIAKSTMAVSEFLDFIKSVYEFNFNNKTE